MVKFHITYKEFTMDQVGFEAIAQAIPDTLYLPINFNTNVGPIDCNCCQQSCFSVNNRDNGVVNVSFAQMAAEKAFKKNKDEPVLANLHDNDGRGLTTKEAYANEDDITNAAEDGLCRVYNEFARQETFGPYLLNLSQAISRVSLAAKLQEQESMTFSELEQLTVQATLLHKYKNFIENFVDYSSIISGNEEAPTRKQKAEYKEYSKVKDTLGLISEQWDGIRENTQVKLINAAQIIQATADNLDEAEPNNLLPTREANLFVTKIKEIYRNIYGEDSNDI